MTLFAMLVFGHMIADYPLQGSFLAAAKNHRSPIDGIPWGYALIAHANIHAGFVGGAVYLFTGMQTVALVFAIGELALHTIIDFRKCDNSITFKQDQWLHIGCKLIWAVAVYVLVL